MELKKFIEDVLLQMADLQNVQQKSRYLVEELEFELALTENESGKVGVRVLGFGVDGSVGNQNLQKVKIKLIPKNSKRNISMSI